MCFTNTALVHLHLYYVNDFIRKITTIQGESINFKQSIFALHLQTHNSFQDLTGEYTDSILSAILAKNVSVNNVWTY